MATRGGHSGQRERPLQRGSAWCVVKRGRGKGKLEEKFKSLNPTTQGGGKNQLLVKDNLEFG